MSAACSHSLDSTYSIKSFNLVPTHEPFALRPIWMPSWMKSATLMKSCSWNPRVVRAGDPMRIPPGRTALLSPAQNSEKKPKMWHSLLLWKRQFKWRTKLQYHGCKLPGTEFLFRVIDAKSRTFSARAPSAPCERTSWDLSKASARKHLCPPLKGDSSLRSQVLINRKRFWDLLEDVDQQELGDYQFPLKLRCIQAPAALPPVLDSLLLPASSQANHCCQPQQWTVNYMLKLWDCTFLQSEIHVKNMLEQNYLLLINLKSWSSCLFQTHCKPPNGVVMWSSLNTQPDRKIMKRKIPAQERFT